jgi:hypothetical protein
MLPVFIIRSVGSRFVVDIIDPHSLSLADAPAKAAGLAKFAARHSDQFGRIELVVLDGKTSKRFDRHRRDHTKEGQGDKASRAASQAVRRSVE